ncbi:MAG: hypothetical protein DI536_35250 [Archangium gephyra]|uniref:Transcription regulator HTH AraC N-terminal domain-containing protein n=1 Tax=Archangium gephyra TaxID=48 RepID=A0A2W5SQ91_9BACT|nr:MAG: hypothetical protein DI536_35250 [Archangium gephyra]
MSLDELRQLTAHAENRRTETGIPRVAMVKGKVPEHELNAVYEPMVNLVLQGAKTMTIGERALRFDPATYFVMSVDLPAVGQVHQAVNGKPYVACSLSLEPARIAEVLEVAPPSVGRSGGFAVAPLTEELIDAWTRMLRLTAPRCSRSTPSCSPRSRRKREFPQSPRTRGSIRCCSRWSIRRTRSSRRSSRSRPSASRRVPSA